MSKRQPCLLACGWGAIFLGIILNPFFLEKYFSPDGAFHSYSLQLRILVIEGLLMSGGIWLIRQRKLFQLNESVLWGILGYLIILTGIGFYEWWGAKFLGVYNRFVVWGVWSVDIFLILIGLLTIAYRHRLSFSRLAQHYQWGALTLFHASVLFIAINVLCDVYLSLQAHFFPPNPVQQKYSAVDFKTLYPGMPERDIEQLLLETWSRPLQYEPFTQFKETPHIGQFVNVAPQGFRRQPHQGAWPLDSHALNIFLFGGSTTFGYGIADHQTLGAYLQEALEEKAPSSVSVYNFGRGYYYSTQERILFQQLLAAGHIPQIAIFVDGLNDFFHIDNAPIYTKQLQAAIRPSSQVHPIRTILRVLPITRLLQTIKKPTVLRQDSSVSLARYQDEAVLMKVIHTYFENKRQIEAVAQAYDIQPFFIWQPIPLYEYSAEYYPFRQSLDTRHLYSQYGYPLMEKFLETHDEGNNFFWAADMQKNLNEALYVDAVHYTAHMNQMLAQTIVDFVCAIKNFVSYE